MPSAPAPLTRRRVPRPLLAAALCLLVLAGLVAAVQTGWAPVSALDEAGERASGTGVLTPLLLVVERLSGTVAVTVLTVVLAGVLFWQRYRRSTVFAVASMVLAFAAFLALKAVLGRERPPWQEGISWHTTASLPSGHATTSAALATVCAVLAGTLVAGHAWRRLVVTAGVVAVVVVAADRVLLGRHYPTDVLAGCLLGVAVVLLVATAYPPREPGNAPGTVRPPEVFGSARQLAVVLNPSKVDDPGAFQHVVTEMATARGWDEPTWHLTTVEDPGTSMAHEAAVGGADLVVVCGGDGTVREVCAELAGTGVPVGIIPAGTGNLLARNLEIPLYVRSAIDVALDGQDRAIDLVEVGGDGLDDTHFLVMAGMGFDAAIMEGVDDEIKAKVGWLAYVWSALKSLMFPEMRLELSVDGGEFTRHRARTVVVGNVGYLQAGMPLLPDARIDDGVLDVVLLHPRRFTSWIPLVVRVLTKGQRVDETVNRFTGREVVVRASGDAPRQLDGDSIGPGHELRMSCLHGKLLVRVPR